jgi:transcription elongation factor GreB
MTVRAQCPDRFFKPRIWSHHMGRWRPPAPASSPYITPAGFLQLQEELDDIWLRRRDVVKALAAAAAEGDRSENAEYIYRKKELGGLDRRIRYLQKRLPALNVVRENPAGDAIYFGASVEVCDEGGNSKTYRIVGPDETDAKTSAISIDSPLAKLLLKKRVNDEVLLATGETTTKLRIVSIRYQA